MAERMIDIRRDIREVYDFPSLSSTAQELLLACSEKREEETLQILRTEEGKKAMEECDKDECTLLHLASFCDLGSVVEEIANMDKKLVSKGIAVCPYSGCFVKLLLNTEANNWSEIGCTPLHCASVANAQQVVETLLRTEEGRKTIKAKDKDGQTPALLASAFGHARIAQLLLQTAVLFKDETGCNPLIHASAGGHTSVVKALLETEEGITTVTESSREHRLSALQCAAINGHNGVVRMLLQTNEGRSTAGMKAVTGLTPLSSASCRGHIQVVQALIQTPEGINTIEEKDDWGDTTVHLAAGAGHTSIVKMLLETNEGRRTTDVKNEKGKTPRDLAEEGGHMSVVFTLDNYSPVKTTSDARLYCTVCLCEFSSDSYLQMPVVVCTNGHSFCQECAIGELDLCPMCREACFPKPVINRALCDAIEVLALVRSRSDRRLLNKGQAKHAKRRHFASVPRKVLLLLFLALVHTISYLAILSQ